MMGTCKIAALLVLAFALLWSAPASSAPSIGAADGWYKWQVEGGASGGSSCCFRLAGKNSGVTTFYVRQENGKPTRIRAFDSNCDAPTSEEITDMGALTQDDSVTLLLGIVNGKQHDMDVREDALFWLAQSNSDKAFEYFDHLLSDS